MAGDEGQRLKAPENNAARRDGSRVEAPEAAAARGDGREEEKEMEDQPARLPDDVLAAILHRVPPRWLAASRCVCRAWRDAIDGRGLLRADLLPLWLAGLFLHFNEHKFPEFFARAPSSSAAGARTVSGDLSFLPSASPHCGFIYDGKNCVDKGDYDIEDHCNGLLLLSGNYVVNPAMRRWNALPACPPKRGAGAVTYHAHLAYDPTISPYYDVVMIPTLDVHHSGGEVDPSMEESVWPPSRCKMYVFSSKSGSWEEKYFVREGDAAGIVREMRKGHERFNAVYFRGALYVHCRPNFLMRVSLSNNTYRVVKPPRDLDKSKGYCQYQIARSRKGVYFVSLNKYWPQRKCWLKVWILDESCGQAEWISKHDKELKPLLARRFYRRVQWILEDINYNMFLSSYYPEENDAEDNGKATTKEIIEWNSDEDVEDLQDDKKYVVEKKLEWNLEILGFHPYKEIVFLSASERIGLTYQLNSSKIEELGNIYPKGYVNFKALSNEREKIKSFPYTPCWVEEFPGIS